MNNYKVFYHLTLPYYIKYVENITGKVDWVEEMKWSRYVIKYDHLIKDGYVSGKKAQHRYWIVKFKTDVNAISTFVDMLDEYSGVPV